MDKRTFKRHLKQNPALKDWIKANGQFFEANPQLMRSMLDNPEILAAFNQALLQKKRKLYRRINRLQPRENVKGTYSSAKAAPKKRFPLRFPSLSDMNQKLSQTSEILDNLNTIMDKVNKPQDGN